MDKVIVFTNERGFTSVCYPTGELPIEEVLKKDCPEGAVIVSKDDLPEQHNDFFDAWKIQPDGSVAVDMDHAKIIHKQRIRAAREPKLAALDVEVQRALEEAKPTKDIVARKNFLRDLTKHPDLEAADTPEKLRAFWPEELK
jgi:hypothetical protein